MKKRVLLSLITSALYVIFLICQSAYMLYRLFTEKRTDSAFITLLILLSSILVFTAIILFFIRDRKESSELKKLISATQTKDKIIMDSLFALSHDLRTSINSITGYSSMLRNVRNNDQKFNTYISYIQSVADHLYGAAKLMKILPEAQTEKDTLCESDLWDVWDFNDSIINVITDEIKAKGIKLSRSINVINTKVYVDSTKVRSIYFNLLKFVMNHTPSMGQITMTVHEIPYNRFGYTLYKTQITDDGEPISKDFLQKFNTHDFDDIDTEIEDKENVLFTVKKYIKTMHGTIDLETTSHGDNIITVTLPHHLGNMQTAINLKDENSLNSIDGDALNGKRVLLVEDNMINAEIEKEQLKQFGMTVDHVTDGNKCIEAVEAVDYKHYDLILMDLEMPIMDGFEATKRIRAMKGPKANIPIIAVTANAFQTGQEQALLVGMNDYLTKPLDRKKMFSVMHNWIFKTIK